MNILVIGAGAIGCLVGAKLAQSGHSVTLVGRPRLSAAVQEIGLQLSDADGLHAIKSVGTVTTIAQAFEEDRTYDFALLTVKSFDTAGAVDELMDSAATGSEFTVISLQNGVGNEEILAAALGAHRVIAGTITTPVEMVAPGHIEVKKPDYTVGLSAWHPSVPSAAFDAVVRTVTNAGFTVTTYPDAQGMKWTKLLLNMVGNATCAILDLPPDAVFADRDVANLEIAAWRETLRVMKCADIPPVNIGSYPFSFLAPVIRRAPLPVLRIALSRSVGKARGGKMPSLHIDLMAGRVKSEVDWLNGATVRKGAELGVETPVNRMLTDVLTRLIHEPLQRDEWRGATGKLVETANRYRESTAERAGAS